MRCVYRCSQGTFSFEKSAKKGNYPNKNRANHFSPRLAPPRVGPGGQCMVPPVFLLFNIQNKNLMNALYILL